MEHIYQEWTLEQDQLLFDNRDQSVPTLASLLGRGLRGVESRLSKLKDVNSAAYQRLFVKQNNRENSIDNEYSSSKKPKLVPASEVLRRVQWDYSLSPADFSILHYDRVEDTVMETPMDAPNDSIAGKATSFVEALPEHRIVAIKYREIVVWDREKRIDRVFGNEGIESVIANYDAWKQKKEESEALERQRQAEVARQLQQILGLERFGALKDLSNHLRSRTMDDPSLSPKLEVEHYVQSALEIFRDVREDPSVSMLPQCVPRSDMEAIDTLSELVALLPDADMRALILDELSTCLRQAEGQKVKTDATKVLNRPLPEINEADLTETFIRGTGPGGQKINKTSKCNLHWLMSHCETVFRIWTRNSKAFRDFCMLSFVSLDLPCLIWRSAKWCCLTSYALFTCR